MVTYWNLFEEYIHPQTNQLIAVVELKRLFQGSMPLEDFHTKAICLVKQAGYEGAAKERVLRDTIIKRISSDKIRAKIVKEGKDMTLAQVMEIARLEISTQNHLDRMQETAKVNYIQYGKSTRNKKGKKSQESTTSGGSNRGSRGHGTTSKSNGKGKKLPFPQDTCYRCGKGRHQKTQDCKALDAMCRGCGTKGHFGKVCLMTKHSTNSLEIPRTSSSSTGAGDPLYFDDQGQPIFTHMVSISHMNKHLIKFPIALDYMKLRGRNKMENSTGSTSNSNCSTILLKADTGADVNLMNIQTFDSLFDRGVLQLTPIRMENYRNTGVKVLGKFHTFLSWKGQVFKQLFYVTDADRSPNLLSREACYTLGVLKPCYTVEKERGFSDSSTCSTQSQVTPIHTYQVGKSFLHCQNDGTMLKVTDSSTKCFISKEQLQGAPLTKWSILAVYSDIFTGIGKFPGDL